MQDKVLTTIRRVAIALMVTGVALACRWLLDPFLDVRLPFVTFFIGITAIVYFAGAMAALLAMVLGGFFALFFFIPPDDSIALTSIVDVAGMAMYLSVSLAIIIFGYAASSGQRRASSAKMVARERMQLLHRTLISIGDAVMATDAAGNVTLLNGVAEKLTGWTREEAAGRPLSEVFRIVNEETRAPVENPVEQVFERGEIVGLANHTLLIARDGREYLIADSAAPIHDADGGVVGAVLVFRDVTEQRAGEKALAESEARKRGMLESALDAVVCIDAEGHIVEFNAAAERMFGHPAKSAIGQEMAMLIVPPEQRDEHRRGMNRYLKTGEKRVLNRLVELTALSADGRRFPVEVSIGAIVGERGPAFVGYIRDISERKRAESARRQSEERFRALTMATASIVWRTNAEGEFDTEQISWSEYTGQSFEEHRSHGWVRALHSEDRAAVQKKWNEALASQRQYRSTGRLWHAASASYRYFDAQAVPLFGEAGEVREWVGLCRDVQKEKRLEQKLQESISNLTQANRRKNEFLAILAHELRNPLSPIANALEIMAMTDIGSDTFREIHAMMQRQLSQLIHLVDDLLDLSRIDRGAFDLDKRRVDLASVIRDAVEAISPLSDRKAQRLDISLPRDPIHLDADPHRLAQVVGNLLHNAVKYSAREDIIGLAVARDGNDAVISVRDRGIGIAATDMSGIFELFVQVDGSAERGQGGLGIGLTLVKRIAEMHGGSVIARSEGIGKGSEFIVRLPAVPLGEPERPLPVGTSGGPSMVSTRKFLIVDDNRDSADSLALLLGSTGNRIYTAYDGAEALECAARLRPDVIVLDIGMPGFSGYDVAREIRRTEWGNDVLLIALTGWGQEADRQRAKEAGFDAHFVKPMDTAAFLRLLDPRAPRDFHPERRD